MKLKVGDILVLDTGDVAQITFYNDTDDTYCCITCFPRMGRNKDVHIGYGAWYEDGRPYNEYNAPKIVSVNWVGV